MIKRAFCVLMICLLHTLWTAGSVISGMAKDEQLLLRCFDTYAQTEAFGVASSEYPLFSAQLSAFFRHETDNPSVSSHPFHDYEVVHLYDVRALMDGISRVAQACLMGELLFIALTIYLMKRKRVPLWPGCVAYIALVALLALYAVLDFNRAFTLVHQLLFTNDLWLLNPQTDLLIALMPEGMFMYLARRVLFSLSPLFIAMLLALPFKSIKPRQ